MINLETKSREISFNNIFWKTNSILKLKISTPTIITLLLTNKLKTIVPKTYKQKKIKPSYQMRKTCKTIAVKSKSPKTIPKKKITINNNSKNPILFNSPKNKLFPNHRKTKNNRQVLHSKSNIKINNNNSSKLKINNKIKKSIIIFKIKILLKIPTKKVKKLLKSIYKQMKITNLTINYLVNWKSPQYIKIKIIAIKL